MPQEASKSTFYKGMVKDADVTSQPVGTYLHAEEFRITVDENGTLGSLHNVKGNSEVLNSTEWTSSTEVVVGSVTSSNDIIFITYSSSLSCNRIYRAVISNQDITTLSLLYSDYGKASDDKLNISDSLTVKMVSRKEGDDIEKIYWVDNYNYLRSANIANNLTTDGLVKSGSNDYLSAKAFGTVSSVKFAEPTLTSSGGGGLNVGMVQYSYQLYNKNGSETSFSPATGLYHLSSSSDSSSNSNNYKGNAVGEESGKSLTFGISLTDYEYTNIRIVSIHYEYYSQLPTINILAEKSIGTSGSVSFTDTGSGYLGSYTLEQFSTISGLYKAKDIASSKNYLFLADLTENYFNIGDWDARTYRFNKQTTKVSRNTESNGDVYFVYVDGTWDKVTSVGAPITSGTNWDIPIDADLENSFNDTQWDGQRSDTVNTYLGNYKYNQYGTRGATGKNVQVTFGYQDFTLDDYSTPYRIGTTEKAVLLGTSTTTVGYSGYCSPYNTANVRNHQRSEVYRYGVVFMDKFGRESVVKWSIDLRMPELIESAISYYSGGKIKARSVYPVFTISNYPTGAVSCKIVRVKRSDDDKSILTSGMLRPTVLHASESVNRTLHPKWGLSVTQKTDLQELISPEVSFYKSFTAKNNDYLEIHDFNYWPKIFNPEGSGVVVSFPTEDSNIKYNKIDPSSSRTTTTIYDGEVVGPMEEDETVSINGLAFAGFFKDLTGASEEGYKGTSLILSGFNNSWSYTNAHLWVKYAVYRRHIHYSQYGGYNYSNRTLSEYIAAGPTEDIPGAGSLTINATYGDTFVNMMEHAALYYNADSESVFLNYMFPVESSINLSLRHDDSFSKMYQISSSLYKNIREEGSADNNLSELYLYNTVYSQENEAKKYFPLPEGEDPVDTKNFPTRVMVSEKKFNGEESDSWLKFLTNNFIDLDATHGSLNNILDYNNNILFWQDRAFGIVDVDPRSLITDNNPGALVLGTGAVLSRFDYLSTLLGNSEPFGLIRTPLGIYWYDSIRKLLAKYNGKEVTRLSKLKGVQSFLNTGSFNDCLASYLPKHDEILFTLSDGDSTSTTLVFNELVDSFTGFYNMVPTRSILVDNDLITTTDSSNLYMHDTDASQYGVYYGGSINESTIKLVINSKPDLVKVFDGVNYVSYSYNSDVLNYTDTFNTIRCYDSYQNTDIVTLTVGDNIERKKGLWSLHIPRNAVNRIPTSDPDIFSASNLDTSQLFKSRLRDTYMVMDFTYNNTNNYRFTVPFVHTKYRLNYR